MYPENGDESISENEEGGMGRSPSNFSQLLTFQIGRINIIGSSEGLVYDKIKASTYNNAVEELEGLLENYIREDKLYYSELKDRKLEEKQGMRNERNLPFAAAIVRLSRCKLRCLYAVMGRHNLFPANKTTIRT